MPWDECRTVVGLGMEHSLVSLNPLEIVVVASGVFAVWPAMDGSGPSRLFEIKPSGGDHLVSRQQMQT